MAGGVVNLFLCGDVMFGRGVDQVLPHPGDPRLQEASVRDARTYVRLAESVNGPVPWPVDARWPWGDALEVLDRAAPDVRVVNLETSVTSSDDFAPGKEVHYRMHPANLAALTVARPDVCVLANNHVLDFGRRGLAETLDALSAAGVHWAGAGRDAAEAERPVVIRGPGSGRVLVFAVGSPSSGVPAHWAATEGLSGVAYLPALSAAGAAGVLDRVRRRRRAGDVVVVSIHWGSNWGHDIPRDQVRFAHRLIEGGVDIVHGHSSHHPRAIEVYRGKLVLYGCGDLIDDYEGISGYEAFRPDLRLLYLAAVEAGTGRLVRLAMTPLQSRRMQLRRADEPDAAWLARTLSDVGVGSGLPVELARDGVLGLHLLARVPAGSGST